MFFKQSPIDKHIASKLKIIRSQSGVTQNELGELVGVTFQQIQKYETGLNKVSASRLYEICRVLNKPINSFFEDIQIEEGYYNFEFTPEEEVANQDNLRKKEILHLIKLFNKAQNEDVRARIIDLVDSVVKS